MKTQQVLEQVVCFSLEEISLWGARKKLKAEDVSIGQGGEFPPADLASLGSKKIFNPKILAKFGTLKKQAHTACAKIGIRFMGGYAVPESKAQDLGKKLDAIGVEFDKAKQEFIDTYEAELASWVQKHPGWEVWINRATIPVAEVQTKFRYGWTPAKISTPNADDPTNRLNQKMTKEAGGLSGRLFAETAEMAEKVRVGSLLGKDKVNRRVLQSVRAIRAKLSGLAFLDKRVKPLIQGIDDILAEMPGDAPIEGLALSALYGLMLTMSDTERMQQFGQAVIDGNPIRQSLGIMIPKSAPVPVVQEPVIQVTDNLFDIAQTASAVPVVEVEATPVLESAPVSSQEVVAEPPLVEVKPEPVAVNLFDDEPVQAPMVRVAVQEDAPMKEEIPEEVIPAIQTLAAVQKQLMSQQPRGRIKF